MSFADLALAQALEVERMTHARSVQAKVDAVVEPLSREMDAGSWQPDLRAIVWEALARKALSKAVECER